jgi:hypothetical protein
MQRRLNPTNAISFSSSLREFSACSMLDVQEQLGLFSDSQPSVRVSAGASSEEKMTKCLDYRPLKLYCEINPGSQ